jgi:type VI secretion system secreted protein Hcp
MNAPNRTRVGRILSMLAALVAVAASPPAVAATPDCFLRVDGAPGESADARHRGEIELTGWTLGVASTAPLAAGAAGGAGRAEFQPLKVTQRVDRASPPLVGFVAAGQHVATATLTCRRPGREAADYLKIALSEVLVTGVRLTEAGDAPLSAEVTLAYGRIVIEYRPQMPDGSLGPPVVTGWDVRANRRL